MDPGANLQNHVAILTRNSDLLRDTLADGIESIARKLNGRFVLRDHQLRMILEVVAQHPEDGVSELIAIIKRSQWHFDEFIQFLSEEGYKELVQKLKGTGSAAVGTTDKVRDGRMADVDLRKIYRNYEYLVDNIRDPIQLCERLHQQGVFDKLDIDKCRNIHDTFGRGHATGDMKDSTGSAAVETTEEAPVIRGFIEYGQVRRGIMAANHRVIWMEEREYLVKQFRHDLEIITETMFQHHIIDNHDMRQIEEERTCHRNDEKGAEKLVEILVYRGENVLPRIIGALKSINFEVEYLQARINGSTKRKLSWLQAGNMSSTF